MGRGAVAGLDRAGVVHGVAYGSRKGVGSHFSRTPPPRRGCPREMTPDPLTKLRYRAEWLVRLGVRTLGRAVPMAGGRLPCHGLGYAAYALDRSRRRIALENLAFAFPGRPLAERKALTRAMFAHFGAVLLELLKFGTYSREQMVAAADVEGDDRLRQARRHGRGVLFF